MRPKKVILVVDDMPAILACRRFLLETRGYRVISAETAAAALDEIRAVRPGTIHLLLADLLMPGMDGNELIAEAKRIDPTLPAMLVSGVIKQYEPGIRADVFLPKGCFNPAEMLDRIRTLVARKRGPKKAIQAEDGRFLESAVASA